NIGAANKENARPRAAAFLNMSCTFLCWEAGIAATLWTERAGATGGTLKSGYCRWVTAMRTSGECGGSKMGGAVSTSSTHRFGDIHSRTHGLESLFDSGRRLRFSIRECVRTFRGSANFS